MKLFFFSVSLVLSIAISSRLEAAVINEEIKQKIISQDVPALALADLLRFIEDNQGRNFSQSIYTCKGKLPESIKPCEESERTNTVTDVQLQLPSHVAIIDFSMPSSEKRLFLINLKTGDVSQYYSTHGVGTSRSNYTSRFSNKKDSKQTSLGFFLAGGVYTGHYGNSLRMYGLQKSNDQAYNRDIVMHGAWYVGEDFMKSIDANTNRPYGRLGHSWGCPAVSLQVIDKIVAALKNGGLIYHYHPRLMEAASTGEEVTDPEQPFFGTIPVPTPRPETSDNAISVEKH